MHDPPWFLLKDKVGFVNFPFSIVEAACDLFRSNYRFLLQFHVVFDRFFLAVLSYQRGLISPFVFISVKTQKTEKNHFNVNLFSKTQIGCWFTGANLM